MRILTIFKTRKTVLGWRCTDGCEVHVSNVLKIYFYVYQITRLVVNNYNILYHDLYMTFMNLF